MIFLIGPRHSSGAHDSDCATGAFAPLRPVARSDEGCFSVGTESVDSWTPGPKPLCHRHPTGPHPSGLQWTPPRAIRPTTWRQCATSWLPRDPDGFAAFPAFPAPLPSPMESRTGKFAKICDGAMSNQASTSLNFLSVLRRRALGRRQLVAVLGVIPALEVRLALLGEGGARFHQVVLVAVIVQGGGQHLLLGR